MAREEKSTIVNDKSISADAASHSNYRKPFKRPQDVPECPAMMKSHALPSLNHFHSLEH
jgi:hypothetical protein